MRFAIGIVGALLAMAQANAQTPFPDHVIGNDTWNSGTHHTALAQPILSPGSAGAPITITGTADAEFVSGSQVRLADGFHAGDFSGAGQFHTYIDDALGPAADLVVIAPDPTNSISGHVLHVPKWEKLELGLQLPLVYQNAINSFFANYYSNGTDVPATPGALDRDHDLNPYADDSLLLIMSLISPSNVQRVKWGFYMTEAGWASSSPTALLADDPSDPLLPYKIRFRFAPDEEGTWQFSLSIKAPHTSTPANDPLPDLFYAGYNFQCDAPLADNHGYLQVNQTNKRNLQFQDGTSFLGLGTNMGIHRTGTQHLQQRDDTLMRWTMEQLHSVGGNFMRMFLMRYAFAPEWVNLGVYDHYFAPMVCSAGGGAPPDTVGNCQYQCWAFDQMLDHARQNDIYIQACIDPYVAVAGAETHTWGNHPYYIHFLEPNPFPPTAFANNRLDIKSLFFEGGDPANTGDGTVFYYWKRKYKYMLARWGYSVNVASIEPLNEMEHILTYRYNKLDSGDVQYEVCLENRRVWEKDPDLPDVIRDWFTELANYVRDPVDPQDPAHSPLGDDRQLFLASFGNSEPHMQGAEDYYLPFTSDGVDLMDAHKYVGGYLGFQNQPDTDMVIAFDDVQDFYADFPDPDINVPRKPFNQGETNYSNTVGIPGWAACEIQKLFHNYDVSFHNEIWAGAFMGKFATGNSWHWERVFWWPGTIWDPPNDSGNPYPLNPFNQFTYALGDDNLLNIGTPQNPMPFTVSNRRIHHHFQPLTDLLAHPSWTAYDFFNGEYTANKVHSTSDEVECYYLKDPSNTVAIGWVHNLNAWEMNNFYLTSSIHNFLGCDPPNAQSIVLTGFELTTDYNVSWFPTRMNSSIYPTDGVQTSTSTGTLALDLSTAPLGGTLSNYLDTLHSDYAFIITVDPFVKSMELPPDTPIAAVADWDYTMYPNPARNELFFYFQDDVPKDIAIRDLSGRLILALGNVTEARMRLHLGHLANGSYSVRVSGGSNSKVKKLIIH